MELTIVDAGVVIGFLDASDAHHLGATKAFASSLTSFVLPASAYAEVLVRPSAAGTVAVVQQLIADLPITVAPIDVPVAERAAALRATHPALRLPDALVVATAITLEADTLVTTDHRWPPARRMGYGGKIVRL